MRGSVTQHRLLVISTFEALRCYVLFYVSAGQTLVAVLGYFGFSLEVLYMSGDPICYSCLLSLHIFLHMPVCTHRTHIHTFSYHSEAFPSDSLAPLFVITPRQSFSGKQEDACRRRLSPSSQNLIPLSVLRSFSTPFSPTLSHETGSNDAHCLSKPRWSFKDTEVPKTPTFTSSLRHLYLL